LEAGIRHDVSGLAERLAHLIFFCYVLVYA
jgi:hypothetical protein